MEQVVAGEQRQIEAEQKGDKKMRGGGLDELFIIFCGFNNPMSFGFARVELSTTIMMRKEPARQ